MINFRDELIVLLGLPKNSSNQEVFSAALVVLYTVSKPASKLVNKHKHKIKVKKDKADKEKKDKEDKDKDKEA
jgi:hypothetical protein